jgi:hypothetical protein
MIRCHESFSQLRERDNRLRSSYPLWQSIAISHRRRRQAIFPQGHTSWYAKVDQQVMEWGKAALSDPRRTTFGADLQYEVMATRLAREGNKDQ